MIAINLSIQTDNETEAIKAVEALSRVGTGLAFEFEGLFVNVNLHTFDPDEDDL